MNEKSHITQVGRENRSVEGVTNQYISNVALVLLMSMNIMAHTIYIGNGLFNPRTVSNFIHSFFSGIVIYLVVIGFIALISAYIRRFSLNGLRSRTVAYFFYLQLFFAIVQCYQVLSDGIKIFFS